jgi:GPH family glycoside/pentoside/hexuronide:cation symporter
MPPLGWSDEALFVYLAVLVVAGRMLDSLIEVPGSALMPELTANYEERTSVQGWRFALGFVLGGVVATFVGFGYFLRGTKAQPYGPGWPRAGSGTTGATAPPRGRCRRTTAV